MSDIALGLAAIPAAVPGLGQQFEGMFSFGMGANLLAAREFYEARITAVENGAFRSANCSLTSRIQWSPAARR